MDLVSGTILTPIETHMAIKKDILIACFRGAIHEIFFVKQGLVRQRCSVSLPAQLTFLSQKGDQAEVA